MGWEERNGRRGTVHGPYYYEKERTADGRVASRYVGAGEFAGLVADLNRGRRIEREMKRRDLRRALAPVDALLGHTRRLEGEARRLTKAHLLATGHHTHKGQWRRRRLKCPPTTEETMLEVGPGGQPTITASPSSEDATKLLKRCNKADPKPEDLKALRAWLRSSAEVHGWALDLAEVARETALKQCAGPNGIMRETARLGLETLQDSLGQGEAGPLERVLIEQVGVCYLVLQHVQEVYSRKLSESHALDLAQHYEKRLSQAQRRFLRAVESLERVRKLRRGRPVQINVAAPGGTFQQVNADRPP